jgi:Ni,Fe-hydrogenase I large subunit
MTRTVIDPVTRVNGHLRLEVEVADGAVRDAWSAGTEFRGIELVLRGRDPREAWLLAQRICGACTGSHALASVRAVEAALGVRIPTNARLVRNLIAGAAFVQGHALGFYQQSLLDWVDVNSALTADPKATATLAGTLSDWPDSTADRFAGIRDRVTAVVSSGQLGPFANGYWGHPAYWLSPEANLLFLSHYFDALDWGRLVSRFHTLLGGKNPHPQTFAVGGMVLAPPWGGPVKPGSGAHPTLPDRNSPVALSADGLADLEQLIGDMQSFVDRVYAPDVMAIAGYHDELLGQGAGLGSYLAYGEFPEDDREDAPLLLPSGRILGGRIGDLQAVDQAAVAETVAASWYGYEDAAAGDAAFVHPSGGQTSPRYDGPTLPFTTLEGSTTYSWLKAPRYAEEPMEVGPLARMQVAYSQSVGGVRDVVDAYVGRLHAGPEALTGTLGRMVARAIEAQLLAQRLGNWLTELRANLATGDVALTDITRWDKESWPDEAAGFSLGESPKGALGHWVTIRDAKVDAYQVVDATTWNASPRDGKGLRGALEEALVGTPVADPARPLEVLRTVHAFDPCPACAAHVHGADEPALRVRVDGGPARPGGGPR